MEAVELSYIVDESVKLYYYFGKGYASVSDHKTTLKHISSAIKCLRRVHENICPQKDLHKDVAGSFSCTRVHHWEKD